MSDEHHTMDELYEYRMLYNAHAAQGWLAAGVPVVKSRYHSDGEPCFGGGWFIVVASLPTGQISNHYADEFWDLFDVPEVSLPPEFDGHTPKVAAERLRAALPHLPQHVSPSVEDLVNRALIVKGHETFAYGQSSYDGDACRNCAWQGGQRSGKQHEGETRRAALVQMIAALLSSQPTVEQVRRETLTPVLALVDEFVREMTANVPLSTLDLAWDPHDEFRRCAVDRMERTKAFAVRVRARAAEAGEQWSRSSQC